METSLISESWVHVLIKSTDAEETVTQVLSQFVQDGGDEDQMSVEFVQEQGMRCHQEIGDYYRDFEWTDPKTRA